MSNLCVIPARGGSKRIPRKNIRPFNGRPMIAHSIDAALASGVFDQVIVSTDDEEIADVARAHGAAVPFLRPAELSHDHAGTIEVIAHATAWMQARHGAYGAVCCLYATAPFVQVDDLRRSVEVLTAGDWAYVFTVTDFAAPIFRSFQRHAGGGVEMFFPDKFFTRSQDLPQALHDAGQFYCGRPSAWLTGKRFFEPHSFPLIIPRWRVQDIDNVDDWARAELMAHALHAGAGALTAP
ncbi:MAG: pseudaminic acid cytidylyltransferase [Verrucomicrobia bacterium]|nr:pseudaminic acid cytidylyltransferase [Verrucomicrobiota bacterium]